MNPYLGYLIRRALRPLFGFSTPYRRDMNGVARHYRGLGFVPNTVIDVGVASGTYELYNVYPDARLILVDPVAAFEPGMKHIAAHHKTPSSYIVAAAGDRDGEITLHHSEDLNGASTRPGQPAKGSVPMYTLDAIVSKLSGAPPYLLKVDVQGAELSVLAGANQVLPHCEVVMLEAPLFRFSGNNNTIVELIEFMKSKGFVPSDIYDGLCRPLDYCLGQIDVAFVRENGPFHCVHEWESEKQRAWRQKKSRLRKVVGL